MAAKVANTLDILPANIDSIFGMVAEIRKDGP